MINVDDLIRDLEVIREQSPLIHNITNYVVMNNTANALLAIGASPVMAHAKEEVADMVTIASALVLNIGTLDAAWVESMRIAGRTAKEKSIPVVLDPVGVGATAYRSEVCKQLIAECKPAIIRGNASEIMALLDTQAQTKGVDSTNTSEAALNSAQILAVQTRAVVVISGETDYITDGTTVETVKNGHPMMAKVTGMGCTATAIVGAFSAVNKNCLEAATHAMAVMSITGEIAAAVSKGNGSLQAHFLDTLFNLDETMIRKQIRL
ncbi:MAG: hydroxyethylthiazole kinase [Massilibacteroides sp.]|nr:hydroxyethylthiazole kinase [Massilibacteroides sp.]MDD4116100.1 hydroxyethylthiazole kinase [Massilibacteroides sp.]MDD4661289.1 hydroxyethylthiazole kinase [Massilibacteroides sp.]